MPKDDQYSDQFPLEQLPQYAENAETVCSCTQCPRLTDWRENYHSSIVLKDNRGKHFWARPVPGYGDPDAWLLVIGLAPGFNGANRTGIPFVGDFSGRVLFKALHEKNMCSVPDPREREDQPKLSGVYISNAVKCVPPKNKPTSEEIANCRPFFEQDLASLSNLEAVLALGRIAHDAYLRFVADRMGGRFRKNDYPFSHGAVHHFDEDLPSLVDSYHTSQQNVFTGRMDLEKLVDLLTFLEESRDEPAD
jgi:uracil-DNA glycosylase family 4